VYFTRSATTASSNGKHTDATYERLVTRHNYHLSNRSPWLPHLALFATLASDGEI